LTIEDVDVLNLVKWNMRSLKWSTSHAVFVTEIDDEHKEIFEAVSNLQKALFNRGPSPEICKLTQRLMACIVGHFAHEERLMRAARYGSVNWHKRQHDAARRRVEQFVLRMEQRDPKAGVALVEYLTSWLRDHTRLADRMMGAFLRNHRRICKLIFRAGTRPMDSCAWVDANGDRFDPRTK
jgi:hemerythrin